jgi:predicted nucleotidyltransferase
MMRITKPKDRDFVETVEGLLFCVIGYLHPADRYTAYLKYVPASDGKWSRDGTRYSRVVPFYHVSQVENTYDFLRKSYPQYLFRCPVMNITVSSVPHSSVRRYYHPKERLLGLFNKGASDPLEEKLLGLVDLFKTQTGLDRSDFGVTGSILTRNHNPSFSDIDLTIYGSRASNTVKSFVKKTRTRGGQIEPYEEDEMKKWCLARSSRFQLSVEETSKIAERRWDYCFYNGTYVSLHPIREDGEITENYGERIYHQLGIVKGTAEVSDGSESIFLPATYKLENVKLRTPQKIEVDRLISYEGIFCDVFREGESVEFEGALEEVLGAEPFYRVVVGGSGFSRAYIKLV